MIIIIVTAVETSNLTTLEVFTALKLVDITVYESSICALYSLYEVAKEAHDGFYVHRDFFSQHGNV
jgi:hypothetical protein